MARTRRLSFRQGKIEDLIRWFAPDGNYKVIRTSYSERVVTSRVTFCQSSKWVGRGLMALIAGFRAHVKKRLNEGKVSLDVGRPLYRDVSQDVSGEWTEYVELDLSNAYATAAYRIGACDLWFYRKLRRCHKDSRLMIVGALGTRRYVSQVVEGIKGEAKLDTDPELCAVWKAICIEVDRVMKVVRQKTEGSYLMYWTDAVFVKKQAREEAIKALRGEGYRTKEKGGNLRRVKNYVLHDDGRKFRVPMRSRQVSEVQG